MKKVLITIAIIALSITAYAAKPTKDNKQTIEELCVPRPISKGPEYEHLKKLPIGCPGSDAVDPGVANFVMNGIKFDIPREYLLNFRDSDGPSRTAQLNFVYPDMTSPKMVEADKYDEIDVSVTAHPKIPEDTICNDKGWCYPLRQSVYRSFAADYHGMSEKDYLASLPKKEEIQYSKETGLHYYKRKKRRGYRTIYFEGNISDPDYWLVCQNICITWLWLEDNKLKVKYVFYEKNHLADHRQIRKKILAKLESFIEE